MVPLTVAIPTHVYIRPSYSVPCLTTPAPRRLWMTTPQANYYYYYIYPHKITVYFMLGHTDYNSLDWGRFRTRLPYYYSPETYLLLTRYMAGVCVRIWAIFSPVLSFGNVCWMNYDSYDRISLPSSWFCHPCNVISVSDVCRCVRHLYDMGNVLIGKEFRTLPLWCYFNLG